MRGKAFQLILLVSFLVFLPGCIFGPQPFRGVISYRQGKVYIALHPDRFYRVGELPQGWKQLRTKARAIIFYNEELKASIATDAFCGDSVPDASLDSLGGQIISALDNRTVTSEHQFMLAGRGALRQLVEGTMDGVEVHLNLVIVRKDNCVFDLYAIMPRQVRELVEEDFDLFVDGFRYE